MNRPLSGRVANRADQVPAHARGASGFFEHDEAELRSGRKSESARGRGAPADHSQPARVRRGAVRRSDHQRSSGTPTAIPTTPILEAAKLTVFATPGFAATLVRLLYCARIRAYAAKRTAEGKSKREIIRCLKRYVARQLYRTLTADLARHTTQLSRVLDSRRLRGGEGERPASLAGENPRQPNTGIHGLRRGAGCDRCGASMTSGARGRPGAQRRTELPRDLSAAANAEAASRASAKSIRVLSAANNGFGMPANPAPSDRFTTTTARA